MSSDNRQSSGNRALVIIAHHGRMKMLQNILASQNDSIITCGEWRRTRRRSFESGLGLGRGSTRIKASVAGVAPYFHLLSLKESHGQSFLRSFCRFLRRRHMLIYS